MKTPPAGTLEADPQVSQTPVSSTATATDPACQDIAGRIISDQVESALLEKPLPFQVYLPPCYGQQADLRYPVLYLLHGLHSDQTQWEQLGLALSADKLIQSGESLPFLVIMPKIPDVSTYPSQLNEQVYAEELLPYVDAHYQSRAERDFRAIGGLSRGATWALRIGLSQWQLFGKIGLHSVAIEYDEVKSWVRTLSAMNAEDIPGLFLDVGDQDEDRLSAQSLDQALSQAEIPHSYHLYTGSHNEAYWSEHLPSYLEWYTRGW
ncbi:MAG: alpha/beta hydrolase-fold protein [Anaerolineaceae bacterium]